ncbi:SDR family oxidoreductase [Cyanobium sp. BA5m-10]|uniref:dTDP-4-dehydrorhamnose reductase family protein n=1 Tax=Cyanobium sp. BA5m-10 TaxID=2823705 RepID=UPI0020CCC785|nr:SDR family oxidoreductase [Cyanobium sp. BA5m-10]
MRPILLVGGSGMLGSTLSPLLRASSCVVVHGHLAQADVRADVTDASQARALLDRVRPAAIVNLAGHTNVDTCEREPNQAYRLNVRIVENLVSWMSLQDSPPVLVHVSTDQLYDGEGPHLEDDVTLSNTYALTKYAGELAALRVPATVLRTNFFGPSRCAGRSSFTDWLLDGMRGGQALKVFDDLRFSPLSMSTLGRAISAVIRAPAAGVFNLGSADGMSKADFAFAFAQALDLPTASMERTTTDRVDFLKTYRPKDMRMDSTAFEVAFDMRLPLLAQELQLTCEEYRREPSPARP